MNLIEQIQDGQYRANLVVEEIKKALYDLRATGRAAFEEELKNQLNKIDFK